MFTIKPDSTAQQQTIQVTYQDGENAVISQGLSGGENVVLTGQSRLSPGTRVTIDKGNSTAVSKS